MPLSVTQFHPKRGHGFAHPPFLRTKTLWRKFIVSHQTLAYTRSNEEHWENYTSRLLKLAMLFCWSIELWNSFTLKGDMVSHTHLSWEQKNYEGNLLCRIKLWHILDQMKNIWENYTSRLLKLAMLFCWSIELWNSNACEGVRIQ